MGGEHPVRAMILLQGADPVALQRFQNLSLCDRIVDTDIAILPDAVRAVRRLVFFCRVPRSSVVNYVVCSSDV